MSNFVTTNWTYHTGQVWHLVHIRFIAKHVMFYGESVKVKNLSLFSVSLSEERAKTKTWRKGLLLGLDVYFVSLAGAVEPASPSCHHHHQHLEKTYTFFLIWFSSSDRLESFCLSYFRPHTRELRPGRQEGLGLIMIVEIRLDICGQRDIMWNLQDARAPRLSMRRILRAGPQFSGLVKLQSI